jgi:hypothetical protein
MTSMITGSIDPGFHADSHRPHALVGGSGCLAQRTISDGSVSTCFWTGLERAVSSSLRVNQ